MCFRPASFDSAFMKCPACGAEVPNNAEKCPTCGLTADEFAVAAVGANPGGSPAPGVPAAPGVPKAPGAPPVAPGAPKALGGVPAAPDGRRSRR